MNYFLALIGINLLFIALAVYKYYRAPSSRSFDFDDYLNFERKKK